MKRLLVFRKIIETILFGTRWILPIFYFSLLGALIVYAFFDIQEFVIYIRSVRHIDRPTSMLAFIEIIDTVMIANLGKMIITGSWNSFVSKSHGYKNENISSGLLKVKMSTSLVGVTAIMLLEKSVEIEKVSWDTLYKLGFVHGLFLLASLVLEVVDYLHEKIELQEAIIERKTHKPETIDHH